MAEIEILPPEKPAQTAVYSPSPFRTEYKKITVPWGTTLFEIVEAANLPATIHNAVDVYIGENKINRKYWHRIKVKEGHQVYIRLSLRGGGGGGGGGKNPLKTILKVLVVVFTVAIAAVAAMTGQWALAAKVIGIGMSMYALIDALIPPPAQKNKYTWDQQAGNPYGQITGLSNRLAPYSEVPRVIGKRKLFPMLGGRPYTETVGNDQYLRMVLLVGMGPLAITNIKIGETPIANIADAQVEIREGWMNDADLTLYTANIKEDNYQITLDAAGTTATRTTRAGVKEISIDIDAPAGMYQLDKKNRVVQQTVQISVQYRLTGTSGAWINADWIDKKADWGTSTAGILELKDSTQNGVRRSGRWAVAAGQYDVKITRNTAKSTANGADICYFTTLRSILANSNPPMKGLCFIALRLKATAQLNGMPDQINCIAQSYLPVWNGSAWNYQLSRNPAWGLADIIRRRAQDVVLADSRLNLPLLTSWASACDAAAANDPGNPYWTFDGIFEGGSIFSAAQQIAAHGRAKFLPIEGTYGVVRDVEQTVPVQHIGPRNSWNYSGSKIFGSLPHAVRVRFYNEEKNYVEDEVLVYRDGYGATAGSGITAATIFETMDLPCCTRPKQAWREGRYHLAVLQLRPETHSVTMDFESLQAGLGQLVRFSHDAISIGLASGRIKSLITNAGNITGVQLDGTVDMVANTAYGIRFRRSDFQTQVCTIQNVGVDTITDTITFSTPIPTSSGLAVGDLFFYGLAGIETAPMIVKSIERQGDLCARITMVDAQSGVWTADSGTIPAHNSYINSVRALEYQLPPAIDFILTTGTSAAKYGADGTVIERIQVSFLPMPSGQMLPASYDIEYRIASSGNFTKVANIPSTQGSVFIDDVFAGTSYEVRVRSIANLAGTDLGSDWTTHTITCQTKTAAPDAPTTLSATNRSGNNALQNAIKLSWINPTDVDLFATEIWRNTTNDLSTATLVANVAAPLATHNDTAIAAGTTYYYWIRAVNFSAIASVYNAGNAAGVLGQPKTGLTIGTTAPTNPQIDDEWINNGTLKVWNGSAWITKSDITASSQAMIDALSLISNITNDGLLGKEEKPQAYAEYTKIYREYTYGTLVSVATTLGITTEKTSYSSAYSALDSYVTSLSPLINDYTENTTINRTTYIQKFADYYQAKIILENKILAVQNANTLNTSPQGNNRIPYSRWENGYANAGWDYYQYVGGLITTLPYTLSAYGYKIAKMSGAFTANGQWVQMINNVGRTNVRVTPNEWVMPQVKVELLCAMSVRLGVWISYYKSDGSNSSIKPTDTFNWTLQSTKGFSELVKAATALQVPSDAVFASLTITIYNENNGAGAFNLAIAEPMITGANQGQTTAPAYSVNLNSQDGANQTYIDANGLIQGVSSGTGTDVANNNLNPNFAQSYTFNPTKKTWTFDTQNTPILAADITTIDANGDLVLSAANGASLGALKPMFPIADNTIYEMEMDFEVTAVGSSAPAFYIFCNCFKGDLSVVQAANWANSSTWSGLAIGKYKVIWRIGKSQFGDRTWWYNGSTNTFTFVGVEAVILPSLAKYLRFGGGFINGAGAWAGKVKAIKITDVTGSYPIKAETALENQNAAFEEYPNDAYNSGQPPYHINWNNASPIRVDDGKGGWACQLTGAIGTSQGIYYTKAYPLGTWVLKRQVIRLDLGTLQGSGAYDPNGNHVMFALDKDINGVANGNGTIGQTYVFEQLIQLKSSVQADTIIYPSWAGNSAATNNNKITVFEYGCRKATDGEIKAATQMAINGVRDSQQTQGLKFRGLTWDTIPQSPTLVELTDATLGKFSQLKTPAIAALGSGNYYGLSQHMAVDAVNGVRLSAGRVGYGCGVSVSDATKWNRVWLRCYVWDNAGNWASTSEVDYNLAQGGIQELSAWFDSGASYRYSLVVWGQLKNTVNTEQQLNSWRPLICQMAGNQRTVPSWTPSNDTEIGADVTAGAVPTFYMTNESAVIQCDYQGAVLGGQLPFNNKVVRKRGNVDVTSSTTLSVVAKGGINTGDYTLDTNGNLVINTIRGDGFITVRSERDNVTIDKDFTWTRNFAAAPNTGGGGTTVTDTTFDALLQANNNTNYYQASDTMTVQTGSNGKVDFSAPLSFQATPVEASGGTGNFGVYGKWQIDIGGTWTDVSAEIAADYPCNIWYETGGIQP